MSLEHLRRWMPWAMDEPSPLEAVEDRLEGCRRAFEEGTDVVYGIFDRDETEVVGASGVHGMDEPGAPELGYWIRVWGRPRDTWVFELRGGT